MLSQNSGLYVRLDKVPAGTTPKLCKNCKYFQVNPKPHTIVSKPQDSTKTKTTIVKELMFDHHCHDEEIKRSVKMGLCKYFGDMNLVDGEITYPFASAVRSTLCKGDKYVEHCSDIIGTISHDFVDI